MGEYAENQAKKRLKEVSMTRAQLYDRELLTVREDVAYMSERMSLYLQFPEHYRPRSLPDVRQDAAVSLSTPYIQYSPALLEHGINEILRREIGIAGNFADTLALMNSAYPKNQAIFFAGSKHGYMIALNPGSGSEKDASYKNQVLEKYNAGFDNRQTTWYRLGEQTDKPSFTHSYRGPAGHLGIACVMPYYDKEGFAGVVGIGYNVENYQSAVESTPEESHINFILDRDGHVIFSTSFSSRVEDMDTELDKLDAFAAAHGADKRQRYTLRLIVEEVCGFMEEQAEREGGEPLLTQLTLIAKDGGEFQLHLRNNGEKTDPFEISRKYLESLSSTVKTEDFQPVLLQVAKTRARQFLYRNYHGFNTMTITI